MPRIASLRRLKSLVIVGAVTAAASGVAVAADSTGGARVERTHPARQPTRAQGAISFAVEQTAATGDIAPRASRNQYGDPSLLLPELRAGRVDTPGGRLAIPQDDPRLKPLGW
jgi:hypothetical protein